MKKIGIVVVAMACAGFLVAAPAFAASVTDAESSTSATGDDAGAIAGVISVSLSGDTPVAATTHLSVAAAEDGEATASTRGNSSANTTVDGTTYEATTERGRTSATATGEPDVGPAVGVGVHGAGTGAGVILSNDVPFPPVALGFFNAGGTAGVALSLSTASTGFADNAEATAGSGGNAQATVSDAGDPDPFADFSVRRANTSTAVSIDDTAGGGAYAAGLSTVFAGGVGAAIMYIDVSGPDTDVLIPTFYANGNVSAAGINSVAYTSGGGGAAGSATTSAEGSAIAELSTLDFEEFPAYTFADAAGRTNASAAFQSTPFAAGEVWAFSGKDAFAGSVYAELYPEGPPENPEPIAIPTFAASALFAGTYAFGVGEGADEFDFEASASAINDPPGPGYTIDPSAFAVGPNGEAGAEIGALYGTARADSTLEGETTGEGGQAGNLALALALGLADSNNDGYEVAGIGLLTFAGAEGEGTLPVNTASLTRIYGNTYGDTLGADGILNRPPYEDITWASLRRGGAYATATDSMRTAGASLGEMEAWANPIFDSGIDLAAGLGITPESYWAAGVGLGLAVSVGD